MWDRYKGCISPTILVEHEQSMEGIKIRVEPDIAVGTAIEDGHGFAVGTAIGDGTVLQGGDRDKGQTYCCV